MNCRSCGNKLELTFVDLGSAPPSNAYLTQNALSVPEKYFPLRVRVCEKCWLVQTEDFAQAIELFDPEYAYFSSYSTTWLNHAERYVAEMIQRFGLTAGSHVVEVAANDGYLLQYVKAKGIPCTGIEPTASTARAAREKGIHIVEAFFGVELAKQLVEQGKQADLTTAINVLAHVPDINDFVRGFSILLKPQGVSTFEFPHLLRLVEGKQFDTIYHEHFSYLSLVALSEIFQKNGLTIFDVEEQVTHGGSLRVFTQRTDTGKRSVTDAVHLLLEIERNAGLSLKDFYLNFQRETENIKDEFIQFLLNAKRAGKKVVAYGAAAKGNTLLNFAGIRPDLIEFVVDRNPSKQGKWMPGSRIPIVDESQLKSLKPDYVVILPWNLKEEIMLQLVYAREWGGQFVVAIPELKCL